jgi:redox-sensitive bicupin YhaK (pirin superfamily)
MEIISYVISGALAHKDSLGGAGGVIVPGDVQRMSAGRGVQHSEFNHSATDSTHFLQIWIEPTTPGIEPGYAQQHFADGDKRGRLKLLVSADGRDGSVSMNADASLYAGLFDGDERAEKMLDPKRKAYVHLVRGALNVNGTPLSAGDAALLEGHERVVLTDGRDAEVLVFDLAP